MNKRKKIIIALSFLLVLIGIILGSVFGGIAISNAKKEKEWQAKQGHDTSLIWVNINNMLAEPKHIENDSYNYENYIVEVPNTTALSVLSYKVGKDAIGEFYYDSECQNKIEDIKNIDVSDELYLKTIYIKIVSQKNDQRVVKIDICIDTFLIEGTERKVNIGGHIEMPSNLTEITLDGILYKVIRQSNIETLYTADDKENFILAENVIVGQLIPEISIFDGNNYEIRLDESANYMTNYEEDSYHEPIYTYLINFECVLKSATTIKNINYIGFPDRLISFARTCDNAYQIKVKNATICDYLLGSIDYNLLGEFVFKNNLIIQESGSNRGMATNVRGVKVFNCVNYTETGATLQIIKTQNKEGVPKEEQKYCFWQATGGISTLAEASKLINCYNYLDTMHGWMSAGGIVAKASGVIIHCNNYGSFDLLTKTPSQSDYPHRYLGTFNIGFQGVGGIVGFMGDLRDYSHPDMQKLRVETDDIFDCNNYGNITYKGFKGIEKGFEYTSQIVGCIHVGVEKRNCSEYGKIIRK